MNHYRSFIKHLIIFFLIHGVGSSVSAGINEPYQTPLFVTTATPPLNMLVMGRDHKLYYEAYNDASDLNNDGVIDVGYKGYLDSANGGIDYYGYFNSHVCYTHDGDKFIPTSATITKKCSGSWSGDYLNYLTTSRMDALRKVLYGGYRATDSTSETILQGAFIPQDAHTWGKEYLNQSKDGYLITDYTPLTQPATGYRHLFAVVSLQDGGIPQLRTLTNTSLRIWNWVSKERPVAGTTCNNGSSDLTCTSAGPNGNWSIVPAASLSNLSITTWRDTRPTATTTSEMNTLFGSTYSDNTYLCGSGTAPFTSISTSSNFQNPYTVNNCTQDYYHTRVTGVLTPPLTGSYSFSVDGDDAVDFLIGNTVVASRYGNNGASNTGGVGTTGTINLTANQTYSFTLRHEENTGNSSFYLYWKTPETKTSTLTDRNIRVSVCTSDTSLQDDTCALYSNGKYKPTGILHDYGATDKMLFGLLSGSYAKNTSGGVLRSKLQSFSKEYNDTTGQFCSKSGSSCTNGVSDGIVYTIDQFRIIDFNYSGYVYGCGWLTTGPITANNTCYMWGNPVAEMMYETMRYFSGATTPTSSYNYTSSSAKDSVSPLSLPKIDTWMPPYKGAGNPSGYENCAVPVMTVISDINSSYDYKVPGSYWDNTVTGSNNPGSIKNLNVSKEADAIWEHEGGGTRTIFIGESNGISDNAPTPKQVSNLSTVRGLSPEEPSKQGTYYSAAIAKFGAENPIGGDKKLMTYAIALASPLPTIKFPVGSNTITVVPFAKSVGGSSIDPNGSFQPTDQIVDFYVETIANTDSSCATPSPSTNKDCNSSLNGGRPYAKFRINYEDVEQGADHDMDAIALYELLVTPEGLLTINMISEYAAGSIDQHMGYIISGTTKDGIYLEVKDQGGSNIAYKLDTPTGYWAGECKSGNCPTLSQLTSSRTFTPSNLGSANSLEAPLWYAAKYGVPDRDTSSITGTPSNYFLVTNALTLKDQLSKAFNEISQTNNSITAPAASPEGLSTVDTDYSIYTTSYDINTWSGALTKTQLNVESNTSSQIWTTTNQLPAAASRTIKFAAKENNHFVLKDFTWSNLSADQQDALNTNPISNANDGLGSSRLSFIRGATNNSFRKRDTLMGDIINSNPTLVKGAQYLKYIADKIESGANYSSFATTQSTRTPMIYVGANDGMLHAINANTGVETFAFIPSAVIENLNKLTAQDYSHQFYVDGSPVVRDVLINNEWRTVLVGTLRAGGKSLFALDITDPSNIKILWEYNNGDDIAANSNEPSDIGYSFPTPSIAKLHTGDWAVITGNGYDSDSQRAVLLIIDIETGSLIKKVPTQHSATSQTANGLSTVKVADDDGDGIADYAYAGDLQGNLWRFDLKSTTNESSRATSDEPKFKVSFSNTDCASDPESSCTPLFTAKLSNKAQPITAPPSLIRHPSTQGYIVVFGTGQYFLSTDNSDKDIQTLYGIWDKETGETITERNITNIDRYKLLKQSFEEQVTSSYSSESETINRTIKILSNNTINWSNQYGWYLDLSVSDTATGERVIDEPVLRGKALFVTSRLPNEDPCSSGLTGWLYGLNPYTGGRTPFNIFDINNDKNINDRDTFNRNRTATIVSGLQITAGGFTLSGNNLITTDGTAITVDFGPTVSGRQSWHALPEDN